ncbi:MAG: hypothetical protein JNM17_08745 [Archangium sp.]|nr:hypothetical protein [Archangium sp.]
MLTTLTLLLLQGAPAPTLADEDPEKRLEAAVAWSKKNKKPQLSAKDARAVKECVTLPAVKATGCAETAKLCRLHEGDDGSSGTRIESVSLTLDGHEKSLRAWWTATYEPPVKECDPPEELSAESPEHHAEVVAKWRKEHPKEYSACLQRVKKKAENDAEVLECDVVLMNACRKEAFVKCRSKNLRKGMTALEHLHRFDF